jgi:hypothetical protein
VSSFLERFSESVESYRLFNDISEDDLLKLFISKLRMANRKHVEKVGLEIESICYGEREADEYTYYYCCCRI